MYSTFIHLRFPFSFFLLPVYLFAVALSPNLSEPRLGWVFLILHFFVYPASNGYNSYFDKDEKSIGGIENPPPVSQQLYVVSLLLDLVAIVLSWLTISPWFAAMIFVYGLASKAYSHPSVRLKKFPVAGLLITGFFQGAFTFITCYVGINNFDLDTTFRWSVWAPALLSSALLMASYPMTQVYQHEEDAKHGDFTLSRMLGIRGTFVFAALFFGLASVGFVWYFISFHNTDAAIVFLTAMLPVVLYFLFWMAQVFKNPAKANYRRTMWLNFLSALCLNGYFIWLFFKLSHVGQYLFA